MPAFAGGVPNSGQNFGIMAMVLGDLVVLVLLCSLALHWPSFLVGYLPAEAVCSGCPRGSLLRSRFVVSKNTSGVLF